MGQRRREPARRLRREPDGQRFFVPREFAARRRDALAAGPGRGSLGEVSLREGRGGRRALVPVARAGLGALRFLRLPARPRLHDVRDVALRNRGDLDALLSRRRGGRALACVPEERVGPAAETSGVRHPRMVLRRRALPAARVRKALPRDEVRRAPPCDRRAQPHVGRAFRTVRALEHELSVRQRLFDVRSGLRGAGRQGGVRRPVRQPPRSRGAGRKERAPRVRAARRSDRGARSRGPSSPPESRGRSASRSRRRTRRERRPLSESAS